MTRCKRLRVLFVNLVAIAVTGCTTPLAQLNQYAEEIEIRLDSKFTPDGCQWLGDVTGSEGHWYSYLFFPNDTMVRGAVNDLRNNALALGADTVFMMSPQDFVTSFTVFGVAYRCQ
ncbi:DUF4156 domain-containing protein [Vibrio sp. WXL210]|uniref:DUF4156 domain-containing protein n=1 Tax=Vibrio sp. WXL210 TaxID=3450709 RepID=UPI003EC8D3AA